MSFEFNNTNLGDYEDVPPLAEEPDDENPQQQQERYEFNIEEAVLEFIDEPSVRHDIVPESDSEEEGGVRQRRRDEVNRGNGNLYHNQVFYNGIAFKEAVLDYALKNSRNIQQFRYEKNKIGFRCAGKNCEWRVWCSQSGKSDKFQITRFNGVHSCERNGECEMLKVPVIARLFIHKIREEPEYFMPAKIEELIMENWKISVTRNQCQSGRLKALRLIDKEYDEQFTRLRDYKAEIEISNPGSTVIVETITNDDGLEVFDKFYVCFDNLRKSWKSSCRPLIGVDGCFLKGRTKGQFLVAVGRDADNAIYPVAWGVVGVENTDNWVWFVQLLKEDLGLGDGEGFILKSDRQKGLIRAVKEELPMIEHRMCVRHIYGNLKKNHGKKTEMKQLLWNLAWSYNEADYRVHLELLKDYDNAVYEDVMKAKPETWCRCFYKTGNYCEDVENNSTESFNATIVKARGKPLVPMLEIVARLAMVRVAKRSAISHNHTPLVTPYVHGYLAGLHKAASECKVFRSTNKMYMVTLYGQAHRVSLSSRTCSCRRWEITGIPCEHAYGVIIKLKLEVSFEYVSPWFHTFMWKKNYENGLIPVRGSKFWPPQYRPVHQAPQLEEEEGNKKKGTIEKRKKGVNESPPKKQPKLLKRVMHCGICGQANHNVRWHKKKDKQAAKQSQSQASQAQQSQNVESSQGNMRQQE